MQIKKQSASESPVEGLLQERLADAGDVDLKNGDLDGLFDRLAISVNKDVEDVTPTESAIKDTADDFNLAYDASQLTPKGPMKNKNYSSREPPYEQRMFNKNLMNGGGVMEVGKDSQYLAMKHIPLSVQEIETQNASKKTIAQEDAYQTYQDDNFFLVENHNIQLVPNTEWLEPPQSGGPPYSPDSGLEEDLDQNRRYSIQTWSHNQHPSPVLWQETPESVSSFQTGSPSSQGSFYSPKGSPENHSSWYDQRYTNLGVSDDEARCTGEVSNSNSRNVSSFLPPHQPFMLPAATDWNVPQSTSSDTSALVPQHLVPSKESQFVYTPNIPGPEAPYENGELESYQYQEAVDWLLAEMSKSDSPEDTFHQLLAVAPPASHSAPEALPSTPSPSNTDPKTKNGRTKNKTPRQEKVSQQKHKPNKSSQMDSVMVDLKKEGTKAMWMGISLMSEEEFTKKNRHGQTCLVETLVREKLSVERAYFMIKRMKQNGDLLSCKDEDGKNALYLAAFRPHVQLATLIAKGYISCGLDVNERFFEEGNSIIHCLVEQGNSSCQILGELLNVKDDENGGKKIFNPNFTNFKGETPLHLALRNHSKGSYPFDLSLVDTLLKRGASISIQNSMKETPLHVAANVACDEKVFQKLFERLTLPPEEKQDAMNIQDDGGNTPLHLVAYQINPRNVEKMLKVVKVFLSEKNTRTDIRNKQGTTPEGNIHQGCVKDFYDLFHKRK